jgi:hypothetical protein
MFLYMPEGVASALISRRVALTTPAVTVGCESSIRVAERIADRDRPLAHHERIAVAEPCDREPVALDLEHGQVVDGGIARAAWHRQCRPSGRFTRISSALRTTCEFVTTTPSALTITPEPSPGRARGRHSAG